jgi:hypothetical protein
VSHDTLFLLVDALASAAAVYILLSARATRATYRKLLCETRGQLDKAEKIIEAGHVYVKTLERDRANVRRLLGARVNESTVEAVLRAAHERSRRELRS